MPKPPKKRAQRKLDREELWQYGLRVLAARAQSSSELRLKLARRAEISSDADAVIARLKQYHYLDDRRFAESYATARLENAGLGKFRVLRDLRQRRVAPAVAGKAVEKAFEGASEEKLVEEFLRRKYRSVALREHLKEPRNLASAYRKLRYAGFTSGVSIRVLKRYSRQAEELESIEEPGEENAETC